MRGVSFLLALTLVALNRGLNYTYTYGSSFSSAYSVSLGNRNILQSYTYNYQLLVNTGSITGNGGFYGRCSTGYSPTLTVSVVPTISNFFYALRYVQVEISGFIGGAMTFYCTPSTVVSNSWASAQSCFTANLSTTTSIQYFGIRATNYNVRPIYTSHHVYHSGYYYDVGVLASFKCAVTSPRATLSPSLGSTYYGTRTISLSTFYTYSSSTTRHYCDYTGCTISFYFYDRCTASSLYALTLDVGVIPNGFSNLYIDANNRRLRTCTFFELGSTRYSLWSYSRNCALVRLNGYTRSYSYGYVNVRVSSTYTSTTVTSIYELGFQLHLQCRLISSLAGYSSSSGSIATSTGITTTTTTTALPQSTPNPLTGTIYYGTRTVSIGTFYTSSSRITRHYCDYTGCTVSYYLYDRCTSSSSYALTLQVGVIPTGFSSFYVDANNRRLKTCGNFELGSARYSSWTYLKHCASVRLFGYTRSYSYGYVNVKLSSTYTSTRVYSGYELGVQLHLQCRSITSLSGYATSSGSIASTSSGTTPYPTYYTPYPTSRPTTTSGGAIAGIVIGNIFFYICCFCVIRYVCCLNNTTSTTKVFAPTPQPVVTGAVVMTSTTTTVQQTQQPQIIGTPMGQPLNQPAIQQPPIQQPPVQQPIQQPVQQTAPAETPGYQYNYYSGPGQYDYNAPQPTPQQPGYTPGAPGAPGYVQQPQYAYASLQGPPTQGAPVYGQVAQSGNPGGPVDAYNPAGAPPAVAPSYMGPGGMAPSANAPPGGVEMAPPMYNYNAPPPSTGGGMAEAPPGYSEAVSAPANAPPPGYNDMAPPPAYGGDAPPPAYGGAPPAYGAPGGYGAPPVYGGGEGQPGQGGEGAATTGAAPRYQ